MGVEAAYCTTEVDSLTTNSCKLAVRSCAGFSAYSISSVVHKIHDPVHQKTACCFFGKQTYGESGYKQSPPFGERWATLVEIRGNTLRQEPEVLLINATSATLLLFLRLEQSEAPCSVFSSSPPWPKSCRQACSAPVCIFSALPQHSLSPHTALQARLSRHRGH